MSKLLCAFVYSGSRKRGSDVEYRHSTEVGLFASREEAIGTALVKAYKKLPVAEGWEQHHAGVVVPSAETVGQSQQFDEAISQAVARGAVAPKEPQ